MVFENGVKNIQAAAYNGARTVYGYRTRAIITRGLYTFYPIFESQNIFQGAFFVKF